MAYAGTGQAEQGRAELADAIYHNLDMIYWLPQAKAALAQVQVTYTTSWLQHHGMLDRPHEAAYSSGHPERGRY
jgi:hypothetical protein